MAEPLRKQVEEFDHNTSWQYEEVAEAYDARRFHSLTGRRFHNAETKVIRSLLDQAEKNASVKTALDLPCGTGRISTILAGRHYDLVCADISLPMLKAARKKSAPLRQKTLFTCANIYSLPFRDKEFDVISCIRLFQHLDEDQAIKALTELSRVSSRFIIANFMYASGYYRATRLIRQKTGRYAPRYAISRSFLDKAEAATGLTIHSARMPQPLHSGNLIVVFESSGG